MARRKRAEVSGAIRELEANIHGMKRDLAHIDATLKMFDPKAQPRLIKAIRPYRPRNRLFEPKELSVRILTVLREAQGEPLTLDAIAERIVGDKGLGAAAAPMVRPIAAIALLALKKRGIVAGDGTPTCGSIASGSTSRPYPKFNPTERCIAPWETCSN
jgi:hypothetical protein